jgi:hypothetical protein
MLRFLLLSSTLAALAVAQTEPKQSDARTLLELSGGAEALESVLNSSTLETQLRGTLNPAAAPPDRRAFLERFISEFSKEFTAEAIKRRTELFELVEKSYEKYYSSAEMRQLIEFYRTPLGKKLAATAPKITVDMMDAGRKWGENLGRDIGQRVGQRLQAEEAAKKP